MFLSVHTKRFAGARSPKGSGQALPGRLVALTLAAAFILSALPVQAAPPSGWGHAVLIENDSAGSAENSQLAVDGAGNGFVVWEQLDGVAHNILANRFDWQYGWESPVLIALDSTGAALQPQVAVDGAGNAFVVWNQHDGIQWSAFSKRYVVGAGWDTTAEPVELNDTQGVSLPEIAVDPAGNAIAVWIQCCDSGNTVWANRYPAGGGWGSPERINRGEAGDASEARVGVDGLGNGLAIWLQGNYTVNSVLSSRYAVDLGWRRPERVEPDLGFVSLTPELAVDAGGDAVAVWERDNGTSKDIAGNRYTVGSGWGVAELLKQSAQFFADMPRVVMDGHGNAVAVWEEAAFSDWWVWSSRTTAKDGWGAPVLVHRTSGGLIEPGIALDLAGGGVATWEETDADSLDLWAAPYDLSGGWGKPSRIETNNVGGIGWTDAPGGAYHLAADAAGNILVVWAQSDGAMYNQWANRFVKPDATPPAVSISSPVNGATTNVSSVVVAGSTEPGARVSVNGVEATVASGGGFSLTLALHPGPNTIVATASDASGNAAAVSIEVTYADPFPGVEALLAQAQADLDAAQGRVATLEAQANATGAQLAAAQARVDLLSADANASQGELDAARANLTAAEGRMAAIETDLAAANAARATAEANQTAAQLRLGALEGSLASTQADLTAARSDINATKAQTASPAVGDSSMGLVLGAAGIGVGGLGVALAMRAGRGNRPRSADAPATPKAPEPPK